MSLGFERLPEVWSPSNLTRRYERRHYLFDVIGIKTIIYIYISVYNVFHRNNLKEIKRKFSKGNHEIYNRRLVVCIVN